MHADTLFKPKPREGKFDYCFMLNGEIVAEFPGPNGLVWSVDPPSTFGTYE